MTERSSSPGRSSKRQKTSSPSPSPSLPSSHSDTHNRATNETIHEDDICPICHLLLHDPVKTTCSHTLCSSCMAHWSDVSIAQSLQRVGLSDSPLFLLPHEIETKCPMCRTLTTSSPDADRASSLRTLYPNTYAERALEERHAVDESGGTTVETLTLYVGNEHRRVRTNERNTHDWKLFVRASTTEMIEEVVVHLHPTFRQPRVVLRTPPYELRRLGWGVFTVGVSVILKKGYQWLTSEAEDAPSGGRRRMLSLDWMLDFEGRGSQGRCRLKVRRETGGGRGKRKTRMVD